VLIAQNRVDEANDAIKTAITSLRKSDAYPYLAESLITQGIIQSRLKHYNLSLQSFEEASFIAEQISDNLIIVRALVSTLEELKDFLSTDELVAIYDRADRLLASSQATEEKARLRRCAKFVVASATEGEHHERDAEIILESFERRLIPTSSPVLSGAQQCAVTEEPVLISGEYELGKKTLAHAMHKWSGRGGRFVSLSCAMLGERPSMTLTKSFARAEAGTVLLENVEELDARAQGMIQRLVETGELHSTFTETAASRPRPRVIATTSRNLFEEVAQGRFSASLYYSLSTLEVDLSSFGEPQMSEH
jgi:DNA-binding NtrC family response regulator